MIEDNHKVTPLTLHSATQAKLQVDNNTKASKEDGLETFIAIEFYKDGQPSITHNTATIERLLYAAEVLRQYALGGVNATPEPRG